MYLVPVISTAAVRYGTCSRKNCVGLGKTQHTLVVKPRVCWLNTHQVRVAVRRSGGGDRASSPPQRLGLGLEYNRASQSPTHPASSYTSQQGAPPLSTHTHTHTLHTHAHTHARTYMHTHAHTTYTRTHRQTGSHPNPTSLSTPLLHPTHHHPSAPYPATHPNPASLSSCSVALASWARVGNA